jgi:IS30 family transposase
LRISNSQPEWLQKGISGQGTNENTNGLIRQYVPKGTSMAKLTQPRCNAIARALNNRPRKRLGFKTPQECFNES